MTAVDSRSVATGTPSAQRLATPARPATARAMQRVSRIAVVSLLLGLVVATVFQLFEGPVARAWYTTRQHQLAAQFAATRPHTGKGAAIALLQVPTLGTNLVVAEGDSPQQLRSGPGHRMGTPLPGEKGNSVIVGHRTGWGGSLSDVGELRKGGHIVVQTGSIGGPIHVFNVVSVRRIEANDPSPFVSSSDRRLTIVTGTGGRYSDRRLVVTAVEGSLGKVDVPTAAVHATTSAGSLVWNGDVLLAAGALLAAAAIVLALRRRYRASTIAAVVTPLLVLGMLGCLLSIDAALPALR